jgi:hypothetical protein
VLLLLEVIRKIKLLCLYDPLNWIVSLSYFLALLLILQLVGIRLLILKVSSFINLILFVIFKIVWIAVIAQLVMVIVIVLVDLIVLWILLLVKHSCISLYQSFSSILSPGPLNFCSHHLILISLEVLDVSLKRIVIIGRLLFLVSAKLPHF